MRSGPPPQVLPPQPFRIALVASASYPEWFGRVFLFDPVRRIGNVAGLIYGRCDAQSVFFHLEAWV